MYVPLQHLKLIDVLSTQLLGPLGLLWAFGARLQLLWAPIDTPSPSPALLDPHYQQINESRLRYNYYMCKYSQQYNIMVYTWHTSCWTFSFTCVSKQFYNVKALQNWAWKANTFSNQLWMLLDALFIQYKFACLPSDFININLPMPLSTARINWLWPVFDCLPPPLCSDHMKCELPQLYICGVVGGMILKW
jgi:molybdopterin-guanine dinucleotide biosynthesis protein A